MTKQICSECGKTLTAFNRSPLVAGACDVCGRKGTRAEWFKFFAENKVTEQNITQHTFKTTTAAMIIFAVVGYAAMSIGILVGFNTGRLLGGLIGWAIGLFVTTSFGRLQQTRMNRLSCDCHRLSIFQAAYAGILSLGVIFVYFADVPPTMPFFSATLTNFAVHIGPFLVRALYAMLIGWLLAALISFAIGIGVAKTRDRPYQEYMLSRYREWEQSGQAV